jgi:serine/threonine protein phosphatase PrpC
MHCATITSAGGRDENQDSLAYRIAEAGTLFAIVCDGLGGHNGGALASKAAVEAALSSFEASPSLAADSLAAHLNASHSAVRALQNRDPEFVSMRTTAVALLADGRAALWGHIGDSRLYRFRDARIVTQTADHSVPQRLAQAGEIEATAIRFHEDRNRILRAVGSAGEIKPAYSEVSTIEPGDAFLLCTDGWWEWLLEEEMEAAYSSDPAGWLNRLESRLRDKASGEFDNYSAFALQI